MFLDAAGFIIEQPKVDAPMMLMDEQLHHQQQYQQQQPRFPVVSTTAPAAEQEEGVATSSSVGGEVKEGEGSMEVKQHPKKSTRQRGSRGRGGKKKDVSLLESLAGNDTPHPLHQQQQQQPLKQQQQQKNYLPPPPPLQHQKQQKTAAVQKQKPVPMQQQKTGGGGGRRRPFNKAPAAATSVTGSAAVQAWRNPPLLYNINANASSNKKSS